MDPDDLFHFFVEAQFQICVFNLFHKGFEIFLLQSGTWNSLNSFRKLTSEDDRPTDGYC